MTREEFRNIIGKRLVLLDGATGTELIKAGMPGGVCPEKWVLEHPQIIQGIQRAYADAGSDIVYAPTFGGNRLKLSEFGLEDNLHEINRRLVEICREGLAGTSCRVFGDIAPTGKFVEPYGDLPFEEAVNIYKEQIRALIEGGVDGLVIETMMDLQEARAALLAAREFCDLPVMVSMTFESGQRTLTGNHPVSALSALTALGADAFGCNCSSGPRDMAEIIRTLKPYAEIPLIAKPNAGLPHFRDGRTVFDMGAEEFGSYGPLLAAAGAGIIGGCCGSTPDHIRALHQQIGALPVPPVQAAVRGLVSSPRQFRIIAPEAPFTLVGERINPTGKKTLKAELKEGKFDYVSRLALEQTEMGAGMLDVNVGMPGIDEVHMMREVVKKAVTLSPLPLCLDTTKPEVAEAALRIYPGRALFNSISAETDRIEKVLPIAAKYGAMLVLLPITDDGIPETVSGRKAALDRILEAAARYGYRSEDVTVDALVMTISSNPEAARTTLDFIRFCSHELKMNTICGLSNVSFGLPRRDIVNRSFLNMAMGSGLNMAIANPLSSDILDSIIAGDALNHRDSRLETFLGRFSGTDAAAAVQSSAGGGTPEDAIRSCLMRGNSEGMEKAVREALQHGAAAQMIVNEILIPGIAAVGEKFEKKEFFLPQLIMSAEAMQAGMAILSPILKEKGKNSGPKKKVVIATVKGDIHDIGKNIVCLMLENYNFEVIDLGKDVPAERILDAAVENHVNLVCLSALMTTTMGEMRTVIELARKRGLNQLHFAVGGAVVDASYAREIGAEYASDAMGTVKIAEQWA